MAEATYINPAATAPGLSRASSAGQVYDYRKGRWVDARTGDVVGQPQNSFYGLDGDNRPFVTTDANLYDLNNQAHAQSMASLQRATTGPGGTGISSSELDRIKSAIGFNDQPALPTTGPSAAQEEAARASAFARAKDTAGAIARSSLTALRNQLNTRGMTGTDYEAGKDADVIGGAANSLGEQNNLQLQGDLSAARHKADLDYGFADAIASRRAQSMNSLLSIIQSRGGLY